MKPGTFITIAFVVFLVLTLGLFILETSPLVVPTNVILTPTATPTTRASPTPAATPTPTIGEKLRKLKRAYLTPSLLY
jgi:hypothetical protein